MILVTALLGFFYRTRLFSIPSVLASMAKVPLPEINLKRISKRDLQHIRIHRSPTIKLLKCVNANRKNIITAHRQSFWRVELTRTVLVRQNQRGET